MGQGVGEGWCVLWSAFIMAWTARTNYYLECELCYLNEKTPPRFELSIMSTRKHTRKDRIDSPF